MAEISVKGKEGPRSEQVELRIGAQASTAHGKEKRFYDKTQLRLLRDELSSQKKLNMPDSLVVYSQCMYKTILFIHHPPFLNCAMNRVTTPFYAREA